MQIQADTTDDLLLAIQQARAAAQRLSELEAIRQQAATLPALEAERSRQARLTAIAPAAARAEDEAARILTQLTPRMKAWRERWAAAHAELVKLAGELPALQGEIADAARFAGTAADFRLELASANSAQNDMQPHNAIPLGLGDDGFAAIWEKVGGMNPDLAALPSKDFLKQEQLLRMISRPLALTPYQPAQGAKLMGRRFS